MTHTPLTRELISDPALWRLSLSFSDTTINVLASKVVSDEPAIAATIALAPGVSSAAAALEEAVYANPMLLQPFSRTDIYAVTDRFHILPPEAADDDDVIDALDTLFDHDHPTAFAAEIDSRNWQVAMLPRDTARFLRRTFDRAAICGHLAVLGQYLSRRSRLGNTGKLYVNLRHGGGIDVMAFNATGLIAANTIAATDDNDTIYYILAVARTVGIDLSKIGRAHV